MKKLGSKFKIEYVSIILIIMIFAIALVAKTCQNDLFFDLKTGESILKHGIDFKDHFSFIQGLTYIYHHYLYDLIIYFVYQIANYQGVFLFFLTMFTLLGISVFYVNFKNTNNKFLSLIVSLITLYSCRYFASNRVQTITYILFFLEIYFIDRLYKSGNKKYSVYLIIISILIANLHMPIWILTIIFFLPFMCEAIFKILIDKYHKLKKIISDKIVIESPKSNKLLFITFIIILFTGLLTPLKLYPYTFFTKALGNYDFSFIIEMENTVLISDKIELLLLGIMFLVIFILKTKIKLSDLCLISGLFLFSLIAVRNIAYIYLIFPTIIAKIFCTYYHINFNKLVSYYHRVNKKVINVFSIILLLFVYIFCFYNLNLKQFDYDIPRDYPDKSVAYIKKNLDYKNIRLYNEFNYGSYLEYYDIPVFIDSRAEVYIDDFNGGQNIVEDFLKTGDFTEYKEVFKKYQFNYALVYKGTDLYDYLIVDNDFTLIFEEDDEYFLFKCF